jgi:hypothetical protein
VSLGRQASGIFSLCVIYCGASATQEFLHRCRMLLSLHIVKIKPGHYRAHVMDGREELGTFDTISISAAIREAGGHALPDLSGYHVWYEHVCAGVSAKIGPKRSSA